MERRAGLILPGSAPPIGRCRLISAIFGHQTTTSAHFSHAVTAALSLKPLDAYDSCSLLPKCGERTLHSLESIQYWPMRFASWRAVYEVMKVIFTGPANIENALTLNE
ncbi:hypothetical protein Mal48_35540 [Thalassoglobus polymorphus]|uniref:Uncharacterized protein n=1 Tax=Thalassoglobus polymorphus TaxID=2527994 RepID=A0A517QRN7_9PLAN|nr:hypothetical protein Mal48_35540 [Thalassoglobus polymorphus]